MYTFTNFEEENLALEIERKYLLKSANIVDILKKDGVGLSKDDITQFYTRIDDEGETRLRKSGDKFTITTKRGKGMVREETEEVISKKLFKLTKKNIIGSQIKKSRYSFKFQNFPVSIDVYKGQLAGLFVLEIEFSDEDVALKHKLPQIFQNEIIKEVTEDRQYKNYHLSLFGNPLLTTPIGDIFHNIEKEPFEYDFLPKLSPSGSAYGCIRSVFFSLYRKIIFHQEEYLLHERNEDLHQFRVNIRKSRSLLQCVDGIFEQSIQQRFIVDLKTVANASNSKRDMDVFLEYLDSLDELEAETISAVLQSDKEDLNEVITLLRSEKYNLIMQEWDVVLRDEDGFFKGDNAHLPYKKVGAIAILKRLKKMKKKLSFLNEWARLEKFHTIRIEFKKLRYLSEYFSLFFENTNLKQLLKVSKKMQNIFGLLQDRDAGFSILESINSHEDFISNVEIMHANEVLQEILQDEMYSLKSDILYGKKRLFKLLDSCIKDLKVYVGD